MKYWIYLAWQYMRRHRGRTLYSILGIVITFVMCFAVLTTGHSIWDYSYRLNGGDEGQLWAVVDNLTEDGEDLGVTAETIEQIRVLEQCDEIQKIRIINGTWLDNDEDYSEEDYGTKQFYDKYSCSADELQPGDRCSLDIQLKDLSNLRQSAELLQKQTGLEIRVYDEIEMYLGQGDSKFPALYRSVEAILASIIALFCIMILRNTMMISVVERMRDYGIYRCVGMSRKQLYMLLAVEGLMMSLVAAVFGVGIGYGFLQAITPWLNRVLRGEVPFRFGFYSSAVLGTVILCVAVTLYSLLEPSRQAGHLSPIEAIHNNIVLRRRNGKLIEKLNYHQSGFWGKLFGAPGEYAYKNMNRNRGRFAGFFVSLLVCMTVVGIMGCVSKSLYATVNNIYQGQKKDYLEALVPDRSTYDPELADNIQKDLLQKESVQKTGVQFQTVGLRQDVDPVFRKYLEESQGGLAFQHAYGREDLQSLEPYLIEGSMDYDTMTRENGVILCDMRYNVSTKETDFNQADVRQTGYQVGDHIFRLSLEGRKKVAQIYRDAMQQVAEKHGLSALEEESGDHSVEERTEDETSNVCLESYSEENEGFAEYRREYIQALRKQGVILSVPEEEISYFYGFRRLLHEWAVEQGYVDDYVIQGIISENALTGNDTENPWIELIHTIDAIPEDQVLNSEDFVGDEEMGYWDWSILVKRDPDVLLDDTLQTYCTEQSHCPMMVQSLVTTTYEDGSFSDSGFSIEQYQDMVHTMQIVKMISILFIVCIGLICMIQIYNTICSNLALRRKELWLYEVVGMSGWQKLKMLLLEHVSAAIAAVIAGYFLSWGLSWYFIEYILNEDGFVQYSWSGMTTAVSGLLGILLICLVCIAGIRSNRKYYSD